MNKPKRGDLAPLAWAQACQMRKDLERHFFDQWPADSLTQRESRAIGLALGHVEEALVQVRRAQSMLSERSKKAGHDGPDHQGYRASRR